LFALLFTVSFTIPFMIHFAIHFTILFALYIVIPSDITSVFTINLVSFFSFTLPSLPTLSSPFSWSYLLPAPSPLLLAKPVPSQSPSRVLSLLLLLLILFYFSFVCFLCNWYFLSTFWIIFVSPSFSFLLISILPSSWLRLSPLLILIELMLMLWWSILILEIQLQLHLSGSLII
jgi:hypothetical protein